MEINKEKRKIIPDKAIYILEKQGIKISHDKAQKVLDFMYMLAIIFHRQHFEK